MSRSLKIALDLPEDILRALGSAARAAGMTPTDYLRLTLAAALCSASKPAPDMIVRRLIATSEDWLELQGRLRGAGYVLRRAETGELMLHDWPLNRPLLPLEDLGDSLGGLTLRFGAPFPTDVAPSAAARRPVRHAA